LSKAERSPTIKASRGGILAIMLLLLCDFLCQWLLEVRLDSLCATCDLTHRLTSLLATFGGSLGSDLIAGSSNPLSQPGACLGNRVTPPKASHPSTNRAAS